MNTHWRTAVAKTLTVVGSVVGITALAGVVLILPLKAQQDLKGQQDIKAAQPVGTRFAAEHQQICASNMRLLATALAQYTQDYDENLPHGTQPASDGTPTGVGWAGQIYPYAQNAQASDAFRCPDDNALVAYPQHVVSYGLNSNLVSQSSAVANLYGSCTDLGLTVELFEVRGDRVRLDQPDEGASTGATQFSAAGDGTDGGLLASTGGGTSHSVTYATGLQGNRPPGTLKQVGSGRHMGGANFMLMDGHVEYRLPNEVSTGTNASAPASSQTGGVRGTAAGVDDPSYQITFSIR